MAFQKWQKTAEPTHTREITIIHAGCNVEGTIEMEGIIQINGRFTGIIKAAEEVRVGVGGEIFGELHANSARIGGKVQGDVYVEGKLFLEGSCQLHGNICVGSLIADEGAVFVGQSLMKGAQVLRPQSSLEQSVVTSGLRTALAPLQNRAKDASSADQKRQTSVRR